MANKLMASAVASSRLGVFDDVIANQFDNIDLSSMMVYLVDVVDASALPWLANQFDVDGFKGYDQCTTNEQRRELIKSAIQLHRHIGTMWGVKKACSLINFTPQAITENVPLADGLDPVWCAFNIRLDPNDLAAFDANTLSMLKTFISYYKNARSILKEIFFGVSLDDKIFTKLEAERDSLTIIGTLDQTGDYNTDYSFDYY